MEIEKARQPCGGFVIQPCCQPEYPVTNAGASDFSRTPGTAETHPKLAADGGHAFEAELVQGTLPLGLEAVGGAVPEGLAEGRAEVDIGSAAAQ